MGQIAKEVAELKTWLLSTNKEKCKAITIRRGKLVGDLSREKHEQEVVIEEVNEDEESELKEESEKKEWG